MKLEAVGRISVGDLRVQVGGQVDNGNSVDCFLLSVSVALAVALLWWAQAYMDTS